MKKIVLLLSLLFPAMLFAQHQAEVAPGEKSSIKVAVPGYNDRIPAATINMIFEFDMTTETLLVRMGGGVVGSSNYDKVWLPQHDFSYNEMGSYMKNRGVKLRKAKTFVDQENFLNLPSKPVSAGIKTEGMTFNGIYNLKSSKKVKELDKQMVPLDGKMELDLNFKVNPNEENVVLTLCNPMPMKRKGSKGEIAYLADDVTINIHLNRCKENSEKVATIEEYVEMFKVGLAKVKEVKRSSRSLMTKVQALLNDQYDKIDIKRFQNTGCPEIEAALDELDDIMRAINEELPPPPPPPAECDAKKLNAEIKSTTSKLNNMVNDWSLAPDAASKAEKKAAFNAAVKAFDAKLNGLNADCKKNLDQKLLNNYEFVKKLVK